MCTMVVCPSNNPLTSILLFLKITSFLYKLSSQNALGKIRLKELKSLLLQVFYELYPFNLFKHITFKLHKNSLMTNLSTEIIFLIGQNSLFNLIYFTKSYTVKVIKLNHLHPKKIKFSAKNVLI